MTTTVWNHPVTISLPAQSEAWEQPIEWCQRHVGNYQASWWVTPCKPNIHHDTYWFVREQDAALFALKWS